MRSGGFVKRKGKERRENERKKKERNKERTQAIPPSAQSPMLVRSLFHRAALHYLKAWDRLTVFTSPQLTVPELNCFLAQEKRDQITSMPPTLL